jgi:superfamily II DNA or RNA helicase/HKD family nuclease
MACPDCGRQNVAVDVELPAGLYEVLVSEDLRGRLGGVDGRLVTSAALRSADAADRVARYAASQVERALDAVPDADRVAVGVDMIRRILDAIATVVPKVNPASQALSGGGDVLYAIGTYLPDGSVRSAARPLIPLLDTTLLTNAPGEPRAGRQIVTEIESADAIDLVIAFIRHSGLAPMRDALRTHCAEGKRLRVLTTTYTGSTEPAALDALHDLGADVRVSYDVTTTRLHAKAWVFHRKSNFTTAYVGSSNLTHSAQMQGMEWNVRMSAARNPDVVAKIEAVFASYWAGGDFVPYVAEEFRTAVERIRQSDVADVVMISPIEIRLEPFQERMLELIELSRQRGNHRNLLVSATGTGKTVMAAIDYARLRATLPRARLLFVAHREEILDQSLATFRHALRDYSFGEKWVGRSRPRRFEHVFASIQSLSATGLDHLDTDHFDVVIVDEFHHAAAHSYQRLLQRVNPAELVGLTATPERADGLPILHWFGDRIAAELRLWDAIDQHRLSPFMYYGIHDGVDLREIPWRRGYGYDTASLSNVYTSNDAWARFVLRQLVDHVDSVSAMRCLGFCVSVAHARFMATFFTAHGVTSVAVSGDSPDEERRGALNDLAEGRIKAVFSVDLLNEGVDVPTVDVVLMLRPTDSATLFLQQLGRGLRLASGKSFCTVLDFVGTHRTEFRFDHRFRALLGGSRRDLECAIENGFPYLPAGCHMELDRVASEIVLQNIRDGIPSRWRTKVEALRAFGHDSVSLDEYLAETGLELYDVYAGSRSWSDLYEQAGLPVPPPGPHEAGLRRAISRMQHIDDKQRLDAYRALLAQESSPSVARMSDPERRLARMLVANLADQVMRRDTSLQTGVDLIWAHAQVRSELTQLMDVLDRRIDHIHLATRLDIPLAIHGRYTRIEILAALGEGTNAKTPQWREGVYDAKAADADLLAFTLDKTSGDFSPTTRYRDYALSRDLIHWESQSTTSANSPTGQRYQHHVSMGRSVLLFARTRSDHRAFWFLGPARYVSHEGDRPMAITWKLATPLSGDLFAAFAAAVA